MGKDLAAQRGVPEVRSHLIGTRAFPVLRWAAAAWMVVWLPA